MHMKMHKCSWLVGWNRNIRGEDPSDDVELGMDDPNGDYSKFAAALMRAKKLFPSDTEEDLLQELDGFESDDSDSGGCGCWCLLRCQTNQYD